MGGKREGGGGALRKTHLNEEPHVSFEIQKNRKKLINVLMYKKMASKVKSP